MVNNIKSYLILDSSHFSVKKYGLSKSLLFHIKVKWLFRGKVLTYLFGMQDEVHIYLSDTLCPFGLHLTDLKRMASLAYLEGIFDNPNALNSSLQDPNRSILTLSDSGFFHKKTAGQPI